MLPMGSLAWRAIPAALIAGALFVTVGGALAGTSGEPDEPTSVTVTHAMLGDDVAYNVTLTGDWPYDSQHVGVPFPALRFTWSDGGQFRADDTRLHGADRLDVLAAAAPDANDEDQEWSLTGWTQFIEAGGNQSLGMTISAQGSQHLNDVATSVAGVPLMTTGGEANFGIRLAQLGGGTQASCLVLHPLQGRVLAGGDVVSFTQDSCDLSLLDLPAGGVNLTASGFDTIAGRPALRLDAHELPEGIPQEVWDQFGFPGESPSVDALSLWFADGLPSPVRVTWTSEDRAGTFDLVGFQQGTVVRMPQEPGPPIDVPLAPRPAWTLDDTGVDHPFPLSTAYKAALADPRSPLFAFVQDEPDSYVSWAWDTTDSDGGSWWMDVTGADETLRFIINQRSCSAGCDAGLPWNDLPVHDYVDFGRSARSAPAPADMPDSTPTVAGLLRLWDGYGDPAFAGMLPTWNFHADGCTLQAQVNDESCTPFVDYEVGHQLNDWGTPEPDASTIPPTMKEDVVLSSSILRTFDGQLASLWEIDARFGLVSTVTPAAPPPAPAPDEAPEQTGPSRIIAGAFLMPFPQQAGVGALALALGLLYWLWPVIKSGSVGLFSRHTQATVLEHPQRARLVQIVEANPGVRFHELRTASGLGNGTLSHHVRVLAAHGHLRRLAKGGSTFFFPATPDKAAETRAVALKSEGARRVFAAIQASPGRSNLDVAGATGLDPGTVHYHVRRLAEAGLVNVRRAGRTTVLDPTAAAAGA